jgi:hypothetical protein
MTIIKILSLKILNFSLKFYVVITFVFPNKFVLIRNKIIYFNSIIIIIVIM